MCVLAANFNVIVRRLDGYLLDVVHFSQSLDCGLVDGYGMRLPEASQDGSTFTLCVL